jgi:hypothetical protein
MGSGYSYLTPCDIKFDVTEDSATFEILDKNFENFVETRVPMHQFKTPYGYSSHHFSWNPEWAVELPEGYSALYIQPANRFELPFLTVAGIIDNDKVNMPGSMPFFFQNNFKGIIPAGTPYAQIIPFKRESWNSEYIEESDQNIDKKISFNYYKYRKPNGGVYKNEVWEPRKYE